MTPLPRADAHPRPSLTDHTQTLILLSDMLSRWLNDRDPEPSDLRMNGAAYLADQIRVHAAALGQHLEQEGR